MKLKLASHYGFCVPVVSVMDKLALPDNSYEICFRGKCFGSGHVYKELYFAVSDDTTLDGIADTDFQESRLVWLNEDERRNAGDLPYFDGSKLIVNHLSALILDNPDIIITRQMVKTIIENLAEAHSVLVCDVVSMQTGYGKLREILVGILKAKKPIRDMITILEAIDRLRDKNMGYEEITKEIVGIL
jgi:flagellar biosynthesis component FlhA